MNKETIVNLKEDIKMVTEKYEKEYEKQAE